MKKQQVIFEEHHESQIEKIKQKINVPMKGSNSPASNKINTQHLEKTVEERQKEPAEVNEQHTNMSSTTPNEEKEVKEESEKFEKLLNKSERVLFRTKTVFPFDFFPDTITIDETKITIKIASFFYTSEDVSVLIHNIADVKVVNAAFFATLQLLPVGFFSSTDWISIPYLWKRDALRARKIIDGLMLGIKEGIDFSKVETQDFVQKVESLGEVS